VGAGDSPVEVVPDSCLLPIRAIKPALPFSTAQNRSDGDNNPLLKKLKRAHCPYARQLSPSGFRQPSRPNQPSPTFRSKILADQAPSWSM